MDKLIEKAIKVLNENYSVNEVELSDGVSRVRVVRNAAAMTCWTYPYPNLTGYVQY